MKLTHLYWHPPITNLIREVCDRVGKTSLTSFVGNHWVTCWLRWTQPQVKGGIWAIHVGMLEGLYSLLYIPTKLYYLFAGFTLSIDLCDSPVELESVSIFSPQHISVTMLTTNLSAGWQLYIGPVIWRFNGLKTVYLKQSFYLRL